MDILLTKFGLGQTTNKVKILCLTNSYNLLDRLWTEFGYGQTMDKLTFEILKKVAIQWTNNYGRQQEGRLGQKDNYCKKGNVDFGGKDDYIGKGDCGGLGLTAITVNKGYKGNCI